jgi:hypothetical protein
MNTPEEYRKYMADSGVTSGELSAEPGWFDLWPAGQLAELNAAYKTQEFVPGFWGFGSNGGGELFAFDANGCVFMIPFVPMEEKAAVKIADSWNDFQKTMK